MKNKNQKWFSVLLTLIMLFSIATPAATAKTNGQPTLDSSKISAMKERLLKQRSEAKTKKIDPSIDTKSNETIKVIVEFNEDPTAVQEHKAKKQKQSFQANKHKEKLTNERANFKAHLARKAVNAKIGKSFEKVFNGTVLEVKASDVPKLAEDQNVKSIYENGKQEVSPIIPEEEKVVPYMADSAPFIGTDQVWNLGYEGEGMKVGVIDTGIDYKHPDLKEAYKGGYDFVDDDADPFEGNDGTQHIQSTHGTHVSGTIAGRGNPENGGTRGIAPKSDLYVYRVLGEDGGYDEWVIAGIEKAVEDGMDVINLSLGNGVNDPDEPISRAVNNAMLAGVVTVVANGNDGVFGYSTVGAPATAALPIAVGASTPPIKSAIYKGNASATTDQQKEYALNWMMRWDPTAEVIDPLINAEKELVYVGFGKPSDFDGKDLTGKIVLMKFGEWSLNDVNQRSYNGGAVGVIVFHADGVNEHINHPFPPDGPLPMFDMRGDDGRELIEKMASQEVNTFTFTGQDIDVYPGDEMAVFSSKGPVIGSWDIKPDLVAPGVNIRSTVPSKDGNYEKAYDRYSGTSMASPHIAGLAALILEAHPEMNVFDVKTALMNTSKTISPLSGDTIYNVQDIGAGRVQAVPALESPVLAQVQETASYTKEPLGKNAEEEVQHLTGSLNFGILEADTAVNKTISLKGLTGVDTTYEVSYDIKFHHSLGEPSNGGIEDIPVTLTLDKQEVTVPASGTAELQVSMLMPIDSPNGLYEGYVYLTPVSEHAKPIQLPFMGYNNPNLVNPVWYIDANPKYLSLNGDGIGDTTAFEYKYLLEMKTANLYLWGETNWDIYGLVKEFNGEDLKKGIHTFNWDGSFLNFNTGEEEVVPSGLYYIMLEVQDEIGNWHYMDIPYIVSSEPTDILVDNESTNANGQKSVLIKENKLHGTLSSAAAHIYRDYSFSLLYGFYWSIIKMEYELYDTSNKLLSKGDVFTFVDWETTPEKEVEYKLNDIFPNGESRLVLRVKDKAGNVNEQSYQIQYVQDTGVEFVGEKEVEVGHSYEMTLQTNQVTEMVGAEYLVSYPSKAFTLQKIVPVPGFPANTLEYKKINTFTDEAGTEYTTVKVVTDLRKNPKEHKKPKKDMKGATGNIPTGKLIFTTADDINKIGHYPFKADPSTYTTMNLENKPLKGTQKSVELFTQAGEITALIKPEALLDQNGNIRSDINYADKEGTVIEVYNSKNGYGNNSDAQLRVFDGYRTELSWDMDSQGNIMIYGLNPTEKYDVVVEYPSHFTAVATGVQPVKEVNGKMVAAEVHVDFGILKAGDVYNENPYDQKVNIYDITRIARDLGKKAVNGGYDNFSTKESDVDKDGQINEKDLSFAVKNFDLENTAQDGIDILPPQDVPPSEGAPAIMLNTEKMTVKKGDIIPVTVELKNTQQIYALQYGFTYDPSILQLVGADGSEVTGGQLGDLFAGNSILLKNKKVDNRVEFAASYKGDSTAELKDTGMAMTYYFKVLDDSVSGTSLTWDRSVTTIFRESNGDVIKEWQNATENLNLTIEK